MRLRCVATHMQLHVYFLRRGSGWYLGIVVPLACHEVVRALECCVCGVSALSMSVR